MGAYIAELIEFCLAVVGVWHLWLKGWEWWYSFRLARPEQE